MSKQVAEAVQKLQSAIAADRSLAKADFRATTVSVADDLSTESQVRGFTVHLDEPRDLGGTDTGPNPVEAVLAALGSCQAIVYRAYATVLGLRLDRVEVEARGTLDLRGFLNLAPVGAGFETVTFKARIASPEPVEKLRELSRLVDRHCPVLDTLRTPVEISSSVEFARSTARDAA